MLSYNVNVYLVIYENTTLMFVCTYFLLKGALELFHYFLLRYTTNEMCVQYLAFLF